MSGKRIKLSGAEFRKRKLLAFNNNTFVIKTK